MEIKNILNADILDIVFEGRNKAYGAYDLRKTYRKRLIMSVMGMMSVISLLFAGYVVANKIGDTDKQQMLVKDFTLEEIQPSEKKEIPPPQLPKTEPPKVEMTKFIVPIVVKDEAVTEEDKPPVQDILDDTKIGTINQDGIRDEGFAAPPAAFEGKGIVDAPKPVEVDENTIFERVEIESSYPGGGSAWMRYLNKTFRYPQEAQDNDIQGTVVVQFIVDREGNVSEVEAMSGPENGGLRDEAIRVIKKSGKWEPAIQNGRKVKSYKKQPITFKMQAE